MEISDNKNVVVRHLDLSSLTSVRNFAKEIIATENRLDVLVNNAGVGGIIDTRTEDGIDWELQVNYYGHFLLTNLLIGKIIIMLISLNLIHAKGVRVFLFCRFITNIMKQKKVPKIFEFYKSFLRNSLYSCTFECIFKGHSRISMLKVPPNQMKLCINHIKILEKK